METKHCYVIRIGQTNPELAYIEIECDKETAKKIHIGDCDIVQSDKHGNKR